MGTGRVNDIVFAVTAFLMLVGMVYKMIRAGRSSLGRRVSYALVCCIAFLAVAVALQVSSVSRWIDDVAGQHSAVPVAEALAMAALCSYQIAMVLVNEAEKRGFPRRIFAGAMSISAVITLGLASSSPTYPGMMPPERDPYGFAMETGFVLYVGFVSADVARLALRFARLGGDRNLLRLSMYGMAMNSFVSIAYAVTKLVFLALLAFVGTSVLEIQYTITVPLVVTAALLVVVFATLPSWGGFVGAGRLAAWFGRYITHLTLYPLWKALAVDGSTLQRRSRWSDRLLPRDIDFRLTRRIIEIHDGLLAVAPYRDQRVHSMALEIGRDRGLDRAELDAAAEAAVIAVAIEIKRSGISHATTDRTTQIEEVRDHPRAVNIADDVAWLVQVTDAFQRSAVVRAARRRWAHGRSDAPRAACPGQISHTR